VLFPSLARLAARADLTGFGDTVVRGIGQIAFLLVPSAVACAVLAEPIVRLLYERGEFDPDETAVVAGALAAFSLGLAFNGVMLLLNRAFFSLQAPGVPTWVAAGNLALNALLYAALYRVGVWGIPLAISLANIAGAAALLALLRRRLGRLDLGRSAATVARVVLAAALLAAVAVPVWWGLDAALGRSFPAQVASLGAALAGGGLAYLGAARALGVREIEALTSLARRSGRRE
jgi:putative peptidoglycan lipid II flippase